MGGSSEALTAVIDWLNGVLDTALAWAVSPAAWAQVALLVVAYLAARLVAARLRPVIVQGLTPRVDATGPLSEARRFILRFLPLLLPLLAYALTALGEELARAGFGRGEVIAFGKRVFIFIAARILVREVLEDGFLRVLGRYVLLPIAALYALGVLDDITLRLEDTRVQLGDIGFSALALVRGIIAAALLFWLGRWSNLQSAGYIKTRTELRPATRELAVKASEVAIFGLAFLLLMSIMGIDLTAVALLGGAVGVGIGLGLQQIAANFISGVILLLEGQTTVGDYVELDDGQAGTIIRMTARACIIETVDGRWVVVPNDNFITSRVVNYSDAGKAHRYSASFSVSYDTDINRVPALVEAAIAALPTTLADPEGPGCELKGFGDSGVEFEVEFWVNGIDGLTDKYVSTALFAIWNTLKAEGIEIPFPHRVVELRQPAQAAALLKV